MTFNQKAKLLQPQCDATNKFSVTYSLLQLSTLMENHPLNAYCVTGMDLFHPFWGIICIHVL